MRAGEVINGYRILEDQRMTNAGMSVWTFAEKGGGEFFIKQFLTPKYLDERAPVSPERRAAAQAECAAFEARHQRVIDVLRGKVGAGGNLIVPRDFFRSGTSYFKVTERVNSDLTLSEVAALPFDLKLIIMRTAANSLKILHDEGIVHGDLKPTNILLHRTDAGKYAAKLIDFDDSYFAGEPPETPEGEEAELVIDPLYAAPEQVLFLRGRVSAWELQPSADIFTLGIIYCQYLTGQPPLFSEKYAYPHQALLNNSALTLPNGIPPDLETLLLKMLRREPHKRPKIKAVFDDLIAVTAGGAPVVSPPVSAAFKRPASAAPERRESSPRPPEASVPRPTSATVRKMRTVDSEPPPHAPEPPPTAPPAEPPSPPEPAAKPDSPPRVRFGKGFKPKSDEG